MFRYRTTYGNRRPLLGVWFALALLLLPAVACGPAGSSSSNRPLGTVSITGFPTSTYLPFWVIKANGFDARHGFDLRYVNTTGGGALYTPLASGHVDASTILPPLAIIYATKGAISPGTGQLVPVPAFWVKSTPDHPGTAIVAGPEITDVRQLRGKSLATHDVVSGFFVQARTALAEYGLQVNGDSPGAVRTEVMPFAAMGGALHRKIVQAALMDYISALKTTALGQGHILTNVLGARPYADYNLATFVFKRQFLKNRPKAMIALLQATLDANDWINRHPAAAKNILMKNLRIAPASAQHWLNNYHLDDFQTKFDIPVSKSTVAQDEASLFRWGVTKKRVNVNGIYEYGDLVRQAQSGWRSPGG